MDTQTLLRLLTQATTTKELWRPKTSTHHGIYMAKDKWIQGAIKHPGSLRKELGAKKGQPIPAKKLEKATHSKNPTLAKRARLAKTLKKISK